MASRLGPPLFALLLTGVPALAEAQVFLGTEAAAPFVPLANLPGITGITAVDFSSTDEGSATITLPFAFSYLGTPFTSLDVGVNGVVTFGNGFLPGYSNGPLPSPGEDDTIFIWWDDLVVGETAGLIDYGVIGSSPDRIFVLEVRGWEHYGDDGLGEGVWQLWLHEGSTGRFEVHYGGAATEVYSASVGWQSAQGAAGPNGIFRPCANTGSCTAADYATMIDRAFVVEAVVEPELQATFDVVPRGALPGASTSLDLTVTNAGLSAPVTFVTRLYLSSSGAIDGTARLIGTFATRDLGGQASATVTASVTVPAGTPPGDYALVAQLDATGLVAEYREDNNLAVAPARFATAAELQPTAIEPQGGGNVGQTIDVALTVNNAGVPYSGPIAVQLYASRDRSLDGADVPLGLPINTNLDGTLSQDLLLPVTLPALTPGRFYVIGRVDSAGAVTELFESNNVLASTGTFDSGPNLVPESVTVPPGAEPGQAIAFNLTLGNRGVPLTGSVNVRVLASPDPIFDLNDPPIGDTTVTLTGAASQVVALNFIVPALPPGGYFPIIRVDPANLIREIDETDNALAATTRFLTGPDLVISDLTYDAEGTPGLPFDVTTRVASVGAPFNGTVGYRLYVSTDQTLDASDAVLGTYSLTFTAQPALNDARSAIFPPVPAGRYYVLGRVDPLGQVAEISDNNNTYAGTDRLDSGPDFEVYGVTVVPGVVDPNTPVVISATIENLGGPFTGPVPYRISLAGFSRAPGDPVVYDGVAVFNSGVLQVVTATITLGLITPAVRPLNYDAYVVADPDELISERSETNNDDYADLQLVGADLQAISITSPPVAFQGQPYTVSVELNNRGVFPSTDFVYALFLTSNGIVAQGHPLYTSPPLNLPSGAVVVRTETFDVPLNIPPGEYSIGVVVDPDDRVPEESEVNNPFVGLGRVRVAPVMPDLTGQIVGTSSVAALGGALPVSRILQNMGPAAGTATYRYYLSGDALIHPTDRPLSAFPVSLPAEDVEFGEDLVTIPYDVAPGTYYLGLYLDPDGLLEESGETNNGVLGPLVTIHSPDLWVATATLAPGIRGAPYEVGLAARGGSQANYRWSLPVGTLPPGLTLTASTGIIAGVPQSEGTYGFTVRVTNGGATADRALVLRIGAVTVPLAWPEQVAPLGVAGQNYATEVVAVGGEPPYRFTAVVPLPSGLVLEPSGHLHGQLDAPVRLVARIQVRDALGAEVEGDLALRFIDPAQQLRITPAPLPAGIVGREYCLEQPIQLYASGGVTPYRWRLELGGVPGLVLSDDGQLCGAPTTAGRYDLLVGVQDPDGQRDTAQLRVEVLGADDLAIRETSLPDADLATPYSTTLTAQGGVEPHRYSVVLGELPAGLSLAPEGQISGTPTVVGDSAFLVAVTEGNGASRTQPLSIRVRDPGALVVAEEGCGCRTQAGRKGGAELGFGLVVSLLWWRGRRRALRERS